MADDTDDPAFSAPVRSTRHMPRPHTVRSVRAAIEFVNDDLHEAERTRPHWQWARAVLYDALRPPANLGKVAAAEEAFRAAMEKDRWLIGN